MYFRKIAFRPYHYFKCEFDNPGLVMVRGYTNDDERNVKVLKPRVNIRIIELPCITISLDAARIWYLYEEVRPYCSVRWMEKDCPNVKQRGKSGQKRRRVNSVM